MSNPLKAFSTDPFNVRILSKPEVKWTVRRMGNEELRKLRTAHTTKGYDPRTHLPTETVDQDAFFDAKARKVILGFEGLNLQGEDIPFSKENLESLCEFYVLLVAEVLQEAERTDPMLAEEREKNSSAGGSGKPKA